MYWPNGTFPQLPVENLWKTCEKARPAVDNLAERSSADEALSAFPQANVENSLRLLNQVDCFRWGKALQCRPVGVGSDNGCAVVNARGAVDEFVDIAIPCSALPHYIAFQVVVTEAGASRPHELQRVPAARSLDVEQPGTDYDARHWNA